MNHPTTWATPQPTRRAWPRGTTPSGHSAIATTTLDWLQSIGGVSHANNEAIAAACLMAPRTVRKALAELEAAGRIVRVVRGGDRTITLAREANDLQVA